MLLAQCADELALVTRDCVQLLLKRVATSPSSLNIHENENKSSSITLVSQGELNKNAHVYSKNGRARLSRTSCSHSPSQCHFPHCAFWNHYFYFHSFASALTTAVHATRCAREGFVFRRWKVPPPSPPYPEDGEDTAHPGDDNGVPDHAALFACAEFVPPRDIVERAVAFGAPAVSSLLPSIRPWSEPAVSDKPRSSTRRRFAHAGRCTATSGRSAFSNLSLTYFVRTTTPPLKSRKQRTKEGSAS